MWRTGRARSGRGTGQGRSGHGTGAARSAAAIATACGRALVEVLPPCSLTTRRLRVDGLVALSATPRPVVRDGGVKEEASASAAARHNAQRVKRTGPVSSQQIEVNSRLYSSTPVHRYFFIKLSKQTEEGLGLRRSAPAVEPPLSSHRCRATAVEPPLSSNASYGTHHELQCRRWRVCCSPLSSGPVAFPACSRAAAKPPVSNHHRQSGLGYRATTVEPPQSSHHIVPRVELVHA